MKSYDLVVLGGGSAGYAAARTAGALGARVAIVDKGPLGGLCILRGCMPSKALLASAEGLHRARTAANLGLVVPEAKADLPAVMARKRDLVKEFADYREEQLHHAPGSDLLMGQARFLDAHRLDVAGDVIEGTTILIATGSVITIPDVPGLTDVGFLTSDQALEVEHAPRSLLVLGGGVIGCELGQFFARIGTEVTLLQRSGHLLSGEDSDVGAALGEALEREGIKVQGNVRLQRAYKQGDRKVISALVHGHEQTFEADEILVCVGRHPAIADLGLEQAGVVHTFRHIPVDEHLRTNVEHIFAAGDAMGRHQIVHQAIREAEVAARNAVASLERGPGANPKLEVLDDRLVPHVVFTDPQVGRVGLTERQAAQKGLEVLIGKYPFADHGKAMCLGRTEGFVKMVADAHSGEILGAAVVGPEGGELLHEVIVAMHFRATAAEFMQIPHVHPTLAEILTYPAEEIEELRQARIAEPV